MQPWIMECLELSQMDSSKELYASITKDWRLVNHGVGRSHTCSPVIGRDIIGDFHTHPHESFPQTSKADLDHMIYYDLDVIAVGVKGIVGVYYLDERGGVWDTYEATMKTKEIYYYDHYFGAA